LIFASLHLPFEPSSSRNPPVPPFEKGGWRGDFKRPISKSKIDEFVKSHFYSVFVIPAEAGIQFNQAILGSRLRGSDGFFDFLQDHQN
jgi:hypothetical protein